MKLYNALWFVILSCIMHVHGTEILEDQRYGLDINYISLHQGPVSMSKDATSVTTTNIVQNVDYRSHNIVKEYPHVSFNTYDVKSTQLTRKGIDFNITDDLPSYAFITGVTPPSYSTIAALVTSPQEARHYFFDAQTGKQTYAPLINRIDNGSYWIDCPSIAQTDDGNTYYMYLKTNPSNSTSKILLYRANTPNNRFINIGTIDSGALNVRQHPTKKNLLFLYNNVYNQNADQLVYKVYDLATEKMAQTVVVTGFTELLNFTDQDKTVVTVDNHYTKDMSVTWPTSDSAVKLYDVETGTREVTFWGPAKKIAAVGATESIVVAVSCDGYLYIFDRKSGKQISKIAIPPYFFDNFNAGFGNSYQKVSGELRILDTQEIAFFLNTAYYYRCKIN